MPQIRRYQRGDWDAFLALDIDTGLQTLRYASDAERAAFQERWATVLRERFQWDEDRGPTVDQANLFVLTYENGGEDGGDDGTYAGHLWLAERPEVTTGFPRLWVITMAIVARLRSRGFGRLLMEHAEEHARARGLGTIELAVDADNVVARKLYEEMGFQTVRLRMVKSLGPRRVSLRP